MLRYHNRNVLERESLAQKHRVLLSAASLSASDIWLFKKILNVYKQSRQENLEKACIVPVAQGYKPEWEKMVRYDVCFLHNVVALLLIKSLLSGQCILEC